MTYPSDLLVVFVTCANAMKIATASLDSHITETLAALKSRTRQ